MLFTSLAKRAMTETRTMVMTAQRPVRPIVVVTVHCAPIWKPGRWALSLVMMEMGIFGMVAAMIVIVAVTVSSASLRPVMIKMMSLTMAVQTVFSTPAEMVRSKSARIATMEMRRLDVVLRQCRS